MNWGDFTIGVIFGLGLGMFFSVWLRHRLDRKLAVDMLQRRLENALDKIERAGS